MSQTVLELDNCKQTLVDTYISSVATERTVQFMWRYIFHLFRRNFSQFMHPRLLERVISSLPFGNQDPRTLRYNQMNVDNLASAATILAPLASRDMF